MIVPPRTAWPPNTFTPSRWELLSRPLRLEPWPFLCAISLDSLSDPDCVDPHGRERLAVAPRAPVVLALLVLEDPDLRVAALLEDRAHDRGALDAGASQPGFAVAADEEDVLERDGRAHLPRDALDAHHVA